MESNFALQINPSISALGISKNLTEKIHEYGRLGLQGSANTQRAYKADLKDFNEWCESSLSCFARNVDGLCFTFGG